jgi:PAS domain S-box-containing protein
MMKIKKITSLTWKSSAITIVVIITAAALRIWPLQSLGSTLAWLTFYPAVMVISIFGGLWSGLIATFLACIIANFFWFLIVSQPFIKNKADLIGMSVFVLTGTMISSVSEAMRQANRRAIEAERQAQSASLAKSEEKYRSFFDNSMDAILLTKTDDTILAANPPACNLFGRTETEIRQLGRACVLDITDPRLPVFLAEREENGKAKGELFFLHKNGTRFPGEITSAIFTDVGGERKSSMIIRNITERKLAEKKLHESEERFRKIFDEGPLGIAIASLTTGKFISVNKAFCNMLGFTEEELMELTFRDVTYLDDRSDDVEAVRRLREDQIQNHTTEKRYQTKSGEVIWVYRSLTKIYSETEQSYNALAMVKDITERKLADKELLESQEMFSKAFQVGPGGMTITRISDGKFINANESFCKMFEFDLNEVIGNTSTELNMWSPEEHKKLIQQQIESGGLKNYELIAQAKSGKLIYLLFSSREIIIKGETCHLTTLIDITDRKQAEEELRESRATLDAALASMTDAVFISNTSGNFIEFNDAYATFHRFRNKAECAKTLAEYPDFLEVFLPNGKLAPLDMWAVPRALRGETVSNAEYTLRRKDTGETWVGSYSFSPVRDKDNLIVGSVVVGRDITELTQADKKIKDSEEKFRGLFEKSPLGIAYNEMIYDTSGKPIDYRFIEVNEAYKKIIGIDPKGKKVTEAFPGIEKQSFDWIGTFGKVVQTGEQIYFEQFFESTNRWYDCAAFKSQKNQYAVVFQDVTERKQAEVLVRESEEKFKNLVWGMHIGVLLQGAGTEILLSNPKALELLGLTEDQLLGKTSLDPDWNVIHEDGSPFPGSTHPVSQAIASRKSVHDVVMGVYRPNFKDRVWLLVNAIVQLNGDGSVKQVVCSFINITDRKQAEMAMIKSEEKFQSILDNSADAIFLTDQQGRYTYSNKAVTKMLGFTSKEMKRKTILDISPADRINEYLKQFEKLLIDGKLFTEFDLVKKDGSTISVDLNAVLLSGGIVYGSCRDITERKRAQDELLKHREHLEELIKERTDELNQVATRLKLAVHAGGVGVWDYDVVNNIIHWDDKMYELYGLNKSNFGGAYEAWQKGLHPDDRAQGDLEIQMAITGEKEFDTEFRVVWPDGSVRFMKAQAIVQRDDDSNALRMVGTNWDITAIRQTEAEIINARNEAENANKAKSEFLANMSHEIRTPMNAVLGYTELLGNTLVDQTQKDYVKSIKSSGRSLLTLINDILDLSKIEAGKLDLEYDFIDTYSFFSEFEKIFSLKVSEKNLKFILDILSGTPHGIYIDEARLRQIVFNLIGNAIKFTSTGHIILKVYTENPKLVNYSKEKSEELIDLIIEVEDSGIGISKELREAIFEPFVQERDYKHYGGTGLGLAITRRLTMLMNGTINLKSELGKGTTFTVRIPEITYKSDFSGTNIDIQIDPAEIIFEEAVILIVDDVEHNRSYLVDALKNTCIKIVEAEDGVAAYKVAKKIVPNLIITDIRMPKMDGFQLLQKIKSDKKLKHIPVIAYSASVLKAQKERIHNSEFVGLLIKPVKVAELYLELMNILPYRSNKVSEPEKPLSEVDLIGEINDLPALIHILDTSLYATWKTFAVTQPIGGIRDFGRNLVQLGADHNSSIIKDYGRELIIAADSYNIDAMLKLIRKYSGIIESLKESPKKTDNE